MNVVSLSPLRTASFLTDVDGARRLVVVVRATFAIEPVESPLAFLQLPVCEADRFAGQGSSTTLVCASDLVAAKLGADVTLVGHAFARGGSPTPFPLRARLVIGGVDKRVEIDAGRARSVPVRGLGPVRDRAVAPGPAAGNVAPLDQRVPGLDIGAALLLEHLHPVHARLATKLPGIRPRAVTVRDGTPSEVALRCDTLWIDTDDAICTLTWRGHVVVSNRDEPGTVYVAMQKRDEPLSLDDLALLAGRAEVRAPSASSDGSSTEPLDMSTARLLQFQVHSGDRPTTRPPEPVQSTDRPTTRPPEPMITGGAALDLLWTDPGVAAVTGHGDRGAVLASLREGPVVALTDSPALWAAARALPGEPLRRALIVSGHVSFALDPRARLAATLAFAETAATPDPTLRAATRAARAALRAALLPSQLAEQLCARLTALHEPLQREPCVEAIARSLLEARAYQRRTLFGGVHLAGALASADGRSRVSLYCPEAIANELPLVGAFSATLLVELRPWQDERDKKPFVLRVLAAARAVELGEVPARKAPVPAPSPGDHAGWAARTTAAMMVRA